MRMKWSAFGPKAFSMRIAISHVRAALSFSKDESVGRATPSALAASVTVRPIALITSSRMMAPGCDGFFIVRAIRGSIRSVVIDKVEIVSITAGETEDQPMVACHSQAPEAFQITF